MNDAFKNVIAAVWLYVPRLFWFLCGVPVGISVAAPVFGFSLSGEAATFFGAVLGAAITVSGALLLAHANEVRVRVQAKAVAEKAVDMVTEKINECVEIWGDLKERRGRGMTQGIDGRKDDLIASLYGLKSVSSVAREQFMELKSSYHSLGPKVGVAQFHIAAALLDIRQVAGHAVRESADKHYGAAQFGLDERMDELLSHHSSVLDSLKDI